ncbi:unnamed protein product [Acanthoscelides obtectus]|uniref:BED-type domain-containing protein n=1 Tax=Acanthoscelides obtectus TaxID=200917 RepID=A0A9P0JQV1_ACAOB|nr:unnamed protein product [Acanthoscelides obtectus]CAK1625501.1 hypothetical protein AOBTE_LOCUS3199 [Acanthoscelides obtectus]
MIRLPELPSLSPPKTAASLSPAGWVLSSDAVAVGWFGDSPPLEPVAAVDALDAVSRKSQPGPVNASMSLVLSASVATPESESVMKKMTVDYLKLGFIPSLPDKQSPLCLLCNKVLGNDAMKPSKLQDHLTRCHPDETERFEILSNTRR